MAFMYLHLRTDDKGKVHATVRGDGEQPWLGSKNSRRSYGPFAVFQLEGFDGLDCIDDSALLAEMLRRSTPAALAGQLKYRLTNEELTAMVAERMRRGSE